MTYSQEAFKNAPIMEKKHYLTLDNPKFEGQTRADEQGYYTMYFSCNGELFGYNQNLYN